MKFFITKIICVLLLTGIALEISGQSNWKIIKNKNGIKVYESKTAGFDLKSIKVECTLSGSYDKFISILNDVPNYEDWIYRTKTSYIIQSISRHEFYYYIETSLPWPLSNRDAVFHSSTYRDSLNRFLKIESKTENFLIPEKKDKVRVPYGFISWYVTRPSAKTIHIVYTIEINPGGDLPVWLVNMFADKGPYESFKKLSEMLTR